MRPIGREHVGGTVKYVSERDCIGECLIVLESERLCVLIRNPGDPAKRLPLPLALSVPDEGNRGERCASVSSSVNVTVWQSEEGVEPFFFCFTTLPSLVHVRIRRRRFNFCGWKR
jgi:hypothetical protein